MICIEKTSYNYGELEIEMSFPSRIAMRDFYQSIYNYYDVARIEDLRRERVIVFGEREKVLTLLDDLGCNHGY